ncbi:MAG: hypothetical protein EZS28_011270 [Streblomastix strix]|uniref:Uncharacterized protein n=1 Tax=Streblomastix strix TaxID=222440 RepID=A0A5J4WDY1_9EUKA|nr:MAG: hypothetical protein EZS28_011270 [Streblomastix strix]
MFVTIAMAQYPTWFFPVQFKIFDFIIDQRYVIPIAYLSLLQDVCGQICYPNIKNIKLTPITHYLYYGIVRLMFDDNPDPQVLTLEIIDDIGGSAVQSG